MSHIKCSYLQERLRHQLHQQPILKYVKQQFKKHGTVQLYPHADKNKTIKQKNSVIIYVN